MPRTTPPMDARTSTASPASASDAIVHTTSPASTTSPIPRLTLTIPAIGACSTRSAARPAISPGTPVFGRAGPAVMTLLEGAPMRSVDIEAELVTPTGAAILTTLADGYGAFPTLTVEAVGYGAGTKPLPFANVLRLVVGEERREISSQLRSGSDRRPVSRAQRHLRCRDLVAQSRRVARPPAEEGA